MKDLLKKFTPSFLISWYHFLLAFLGAIIYRFPSQKIFVVSVTGTKGKSTVVNLAGKILEEAGFKTGWVTSLTLKIGKKEWLNPYHMTMPGRFLIQKFLREMVDNKCHYALIEVTSEGILQYRHRFIDFKAAVFTNLAPEHIEAHGSFEKYREAKGKLFALAKDIHIINLDDENSDYFLKFPAKKKYTYGLNRGDVNRQNTKFKINLLGDFNIYNALAAICIGLSQGVDLEICKKALEKVKGIPGRMEIIDEGQDFTVIVDLAHTPDSFEKVFKLVNDLPHNKIISVFGSAGGGRDRWKRPELGKIAAEYSDQIVLTNEDPYEEDPLVILNQIESGIKNSQAPIIKILDRREAIRKAFQSAQKNDIVLVLGKGTEQTMVIGSKKIPWDDREVAREELKNISL
jgi:UDP-N-acetylmuramoyl-L-alanyl-D-glutamate--2,6-diaminopimelate ligase